MNTLKKSQRIPNFEILRTISMLFVVLVHFCGLGLTRYGNKLPVEYNLSFISTLNFIFVNIIQIVVNVAVNCFVMISGYFLINKTELKFKHIEKIWLHAIFYVVLIGIIAYIIQQNNENLKIIIRPFYIGNTGYWFVDKYIGLMLISPFLSKYANLLDKKQYKIFLLVLSISCISIFTGFLGNIGYLNGGYSFQWFVFLYFIAGYIRKFNPFNNFRTDYHLWLFFILLCIINVTFHYIKFGIRNPYIDASYNGLSFLVSVSFFLMFKNHNFKSYIWKPLILIAPYTFGVYLVFSSPFVDHLLWCSELAPSKYINSWTLFPFMIGECLTIFLVGIIIDYFRTLFVMLIRGQKILDWFNVCVVRLLKPLFTKYIFKE